MANNELMKFPLNINENGDTPFVKLVAMDWSASKRRNVKIKNTKKISDTIILPLPSNGLADSLNISWQEDAGLMAAGVVSAIKHAGISSIKNLLGGVSAKISYNRGITINDLASSTFENVEFRTHSFDWSLIPTSEDEAKALKKIIQRFKQKALPSRVSENVLVYPSFWKIEIRSAQYNILLDYDVSVITEISTDFMPESIESFHADGEPVETSLSISFKELFRTTRDDYTDSNEE